jgi:aminopeptidase N
MSSMQPIHLEDYQPPAYFVPEVDLHVDIHEDISRVTATLTLEANPERPNAPLDLDGAGQPFSDLAIDGRVLAPDEYEILGKGLRIPQLPERCTLSIVNEICPQKNKALEGFYQSGDILCTQCEAHGFRRITYFPDRPDVMSVYTVTMEADAARYPILLANGNPIASRELPSGRHEATWHDPFKKPAYLFAMVAGDLGLVEDSFTTMSGREVALRIYVDHGNEDRCPHAIDSLKRSMRWDEEVYGREYDLDLFMIVAVDAFNYGAMENKGLNVFNSSCVLAKRETATDGDFERIEAIIAHEYFHNWTGNRVTCRDWFQLTLKEGLTVFRDQEFTADTHDRTVKRIADVVSLRNYQFAEDSGPTAHPIKPKHYIEINNFYTATVYNKGAEVIRMIHTLLGPEGFRRGSDLYFERHDGQAVTTEDFVAAMADANDADFSQFVRWYHQGGTPQLAISGHYDAEAQTYTLRTSQSCRQLPDYPAPQPFHIPLKVGLLDRSGKELAAELLNVTETEQSFEFPNIASEPVPSLLRDFSAPVRVDFPYSQDELIFLLAHDSNAFNRFEAGQRGATLEIHTMMAGQEAASEAILDAFAALLADELPPAFVAIAIGPPSVNELVESMDVCDYPLAWRARRAFCSQFAARHRDALLAAYQANRDDGSMSAQAISQRSLKNACLSYLGLLDDSELRRLIIAQHEAAPNMTDEIAALSILANIEGEHRQLALDRFANRWQDDGLVMNKWFAAQARATIPGVREHLLALTTHPAFDPENPNKVRSLYGAFAGNPVHFHAPDGSGYALLADEVLALNAFNPMVAGRLAIAFRKYKRLPTDAQALMKRELERIMASPDLSPDVYEIISKTLA